ncbi:hypothetical protein NLJ89_g3447 [Agrocybe chaxingu]|uniref:Uncharacterized protein n=1 Tax=Agrocybe chaxingu TaxID=84603 RepID=A0A9W8K4L4_9AGAR|nr:hypothetical protein NLJ89_g3447 [Agrocybe chaxingu]
MTLAPSPQPLPTNPFIPETPTHDAYDQCLSLEQQPGWHVFESDLGRDFSESIMRDMSPVIVARVLGHALRLAPSDEGREVLTREIIDCEAHPELLAGLGHLYVYGMIRVFYNPKGPTPSISAIQSPRRSFEEVVNARSHLLSAPLVTTRELRQLTLIRDENSCVFTGDLDVGIDRPVLVAALDLDPDRPTASTHVAHIISQTLSSDIGGMTQAARDKVLFMLLLSQFFQYAVLERFGGFSAHAILGEANLNSALNALTASGTPHSWFDCLNLWLVPAKDEHGAVISDTYDVRYPTSEDPRRFRNARLKQRISFRTGSTTDGTGTVIPPPHPRILALHAACAQVAHLSGAVAHVSEFYGNPDPDGISVMTEPSAPTELVRKLKTLQLISSTA